MCFVFRLAFGRCGVVVEAAEGKGKKWHVIWAHGVTGSVPSQSPQGVVAGPNAA
jgi:hypothetical protein